MVPKHLNGMRVADAISYYVLLPDEDAVCFDYMIGDATMRLMPVHLHDEAFDHKEFLTVKLQSFDKKTRTMEVSIVENNVHGISIARRIIVLHLDFREGVGTGGLILVANIDGINYDPKATTASSEWNDCFAES